jgi:hypothetical protein
MHLRGVAAAGRLMARTGPRPKVAIRQVGAGAVAAPAQQGSRSARFCSRRCFLSVDELQRGQHRHTLALHLGGGGGKSESMATDVLQVLDVVRLAT